MAAQILSFRELRVYRAATKLQQAVFQKSQVWPHDEKYSLTDQVRRSSRSVGANIAESWAKRNYPAHFVSKLTDADGELQETAHWLLTAEACKYINEAELSEFHSHRRNWQNAWQNDVHAGKIHARPEVGRQMTEARGRMTDDRGQRSEVRGLISDFRPPASGLRPPASVVKKCATKPCRRCLNFSRWMIH